MILIKPSVEFVDAVDRDAILKKIERCARTCYKSEDKITEASAAKMVKALTKSGHLAMLEHASLTVKFITDRGVSHEIVRHRMASYAQESTRYVKYGNSARSGAEDIKFIIPAWSSLQEGVYRHPTYNNEAVLRDNEEVPLTEEEKAFVCALLDAERSYNRLMELGQQAQQARAVLPNALKTEICMTANLREWLHFINLRSKGTTGAPHPDIKMVADMVAAKFAEELPEIFGEF